MDWESHDPLYLATLAGGLRENSRSAMRLAGVSHSIEARLMGHIVDLIHIYFWSRTDDAKNGLNRPEPVLGGGRTNEENPESPILFDTPDAFEENMKRFDDGGE
ncbi:MAG: DUF5361 domain-containing protein [Clostridiales Family XIII bacterium]|nr:DUF5361 domain-containing protein [Clostridiales Family XIII bacterium]